MIMLSRQESGILKGVAILIMLFLHLFNRENNVDICMSYFYFRGEPVVFQLSKFAAICVHLYLFLSGYGLYITFLKSGNMHNVRRVLSLYVNFWIVFALFIGLASVLKPTAYPGAVTTFISNFIGWRTTYNGEWWFLFPYVLLALSSWKIMHAIYRMHYVVLFLILGSLYLVSFLLTKMNMDYIYTHRLVYMPILYLNLLFPFGIGAIFAKEDWFGKFEKQIKVLKHENLWLILSILFLIFIRILLPVSVFNPVFAFCFLLLFASLKRPKWFNWFLSKMGEQSTNMWLIHTFFCYYLFRDFIYGFKYPIIIYVVLLTVSYLSARLIDMINKPIQRIINKRL